MNVCSIEFVLAVLLTASVFHQLSRVRLKQVFLAMANVTFLYTLVPDVQSWVALGIFVTSGYVIARILQVFPNRTLLWAYVVLVVGAFLLLKRYAFVMAVLPASFFESTITVVGISYLLFRQIHVGVDALEGQIERLPVWTYVNYQLNLFALLSGPIQRFQDFQANWDRLEPLCTNADEMLRAYLRIFWGVAKVAILSVVFLSLHDKYDAILSGDISKHPRFKAVAWFLLLLYLYPLYIYCNFSGYCDIVIGAARLFGISMPENFNWPFVSRNMIDYWTRWHRTLGFWIRDYLFTPMYMALVRSWPKYATTLAIGCYFIALTVTGIWHGSTWNFVVYGLLNGLGVSAAKLWELRLVSRIGRPGLRNYLESRPIHVCAVIANFHFACFTMFFFPSHLGHRLHLLSNVVFRLS